MAVRIITGTFSGSPSKALEIEASVLPSHIRHLKLQLNYALRLLRLQSSHPLLDLLFTSIQDELSTITTPDFGLLEFMDENSTQLQKIYQKLKSFSNLDKFEYSNHAWSPPWLIGYIDISITHLDKETAKQNHLSFLPHIPEDAAIVYTDASLTKENQSSIGYVAYLPNTREETRFSFNLGDQMGITDAETFCILSAVQFLHSKTSKGSEWYIYSDSRAAIRRIKDAPNLFSHKIRKKALNHNVHLDWCPGHMGIKGNEIADSLAKQASNHTPQNI